MSAHMVRFDWLTDPLLMREELNCAYMVPGVDCVQTTHSDLTAVMLQSSANSLVIMV